MVDVDARINAKCNQVAIRKRKWESKQAAAEKGGAMKPAPSNSTCYENVDIHQWLDGWANGSVNNEDDKKVVLPLVDLRSKEDFDKRHLSFPPSATAEEKGGADAATADARRDATIVNLPLSSLLSGERSCELPPRNVEFAIMVPAQFSRVFIGDEDCSVRRLFFASRSGATMQSRRPWLVRQVLIDEESLWKTAMEMGLVQSLTGGRSGGDGTFPFRSLPRLWKPDPLMSSDILLLLKEWVLKEEPPRSNEKKDVVATTPPSEKSVGIVLDLGSGAGRDICYLAEELKEFQCHQNRSKSSIHFVGIDNHKGSAKRCLPLWTKRGVGDITNSRNIDLNKLHLVRDHFTDLSKLLLRPAEGSDILCIFAVRFLNRRLLSYIAGSQSNHDASASAAPASLAMASKHAIHSPPPPLVLPLGTLIAISHFCKQEEGAHWNFDHPKESSVLNRWELKTLFGDAVCVSSNGAKVQKWKILKDDIVPDGDHGRTLIQFIVRKVA